MLSQQKLTPVKNIDDPITFLDMVAIVPPDGNTNYYGEYSHNGQTIFGPSSTAKERIFLQIATLIDHAAARHIPITPQDANKGECKI